MSKSPKSRRKASQVQTAPSPVPAALPPSPVNAAVIRARLLAVATLGLTALCLGIYTVNSLPDRWNPFAEPAPEPVYIVQKRIPPPVPELPVQRSFVPAPEEPAGINLSIESRETEEKADDLSARAAARAARKAAAEKKAAEETKDKDEAKSKDKMELAVTTAPRDADMARADTLVETKEWKEALAVYNKILKKDKNNMEALHGKVYVLEKRGAEDALDGLDALADRYPNAAFVHAARARILVRQNDTLEALKAWEKAVRLDPKNEDYKLGLAVLNDRLGRDADALRLYKQLAKPLPADAQKRVDYLSDKLASQK